MEVSETGARGGARKISRMRKRKRCVGICEELRSRRRGVPVREERQASAWGVSYYYYNAGRE